jgi:hypothetical protein
MRSLVRLLLATSLAVPLAAQQDSRPDAPPRAQRKHSAQNEQGNAHRHAPNDLNEQVAGEERQGNGNDGQQGNWNDGQQNNWSDGQSGNSNDGQLGNWNQGQQNRRSEGRHGNWNDGQRGGYDDKLGSGSPRDGQHSGDRQAISSAATATRRREEGERSLQPHATPPPTVRE